MATPQTGSAGASILDAWVGKSPLSAHKIAAALVISDTHLSRLRSGERSPSRKLANAIERLTGGNVSVASWDEPAPKTRKPGREKRAA